MADSPDVQENSSNVVPTTPVDQPTDTIKPEASPLISTKRPVPKGLTPWKKGQPGNPLKKNMGRPKIADRLEKWGKLKVSQGILDKFKDMFPDIKIKDADDAWTQRVMMAAIHGESWAANFIAERREGKVKQSVEMSGRMGIDLHDISDDELERRIADAARRAAALDAGEAETAGSQ